MAATRWAQIVDALLAAVRARPGYRGPTGTTGILVLDSTEEHAIEERPGRYVVIAVADIAGQGDESGSAAQSPATAGKVQRDERGTIRCRTVCQLGDVAPAVARGNALTDLAVVEDVLRTDPTLGIVAPRIFVQVGDRLTFRSYLAGGSVLTVEFTIDYHTRI
jgi:hypothetical protein